MKIKMTTKHRILPSSKIIDIFSIYWTTKGLAEPTYYFGITEGNGGLISYRSIDEEYEMIVVEPTLNFKTVFVQQTESLSAVLHWSLVQENLLEGVTSYQPDAYNKFLEIIKSEGLVDEDFY